MYLARVCDSTRCEPIYTEGCCTWHTAGHISVQRQVRGAAWNGPANVGTNGGTFSLLYLRIYAQIAYSVAAYIWTGNAYQPFSRYLKVLELFTSI